MKNDTIQHLLERYRQGTLSDSELADLTRLTHRDEVMDNAERRAVGIVRRRRSIAFSVAGLLVAGAATWTLLGPNQTEAPLVAEASVPEIVVTAPEPAVEQAAPVAKPQRALDMPRPERAVRSTIKKKTDDPVVVCNNQCEADSVINDIWKFLTV